MDAKKIQLQRLHLQACDLEELSASLAVIGLDKIADELRVTVRVLREVKTALED